MTNPIAAFREDVTAKLTAVGIAALPYFPANLSAPGAVLAHGSPYLAKGDTFNELEVRLDLILFTGTGDNASSTTGLDQLVVTALGALWDDYGPLEVGEPYILRVQNADYLAAQVTISDYFTLK